MLILLLSLTIWCNVVTSKGFLPFHLLEKGATKVPRLNTEIGSTTEPLIDPAAYPSTKNNHTTQHPTQPTGTFISKRALLPSTSSKVRALSLFTDKLMFIPPMIIHPIIEPPMFIPPMIEPPMIKPLMITYCSNASVPEVIKLRVTSVMHLVCAVVLATGAMLQIFLIFKYHRNKISSFVMMLYDSFTKLFFVIILLVAVYTQRQGYMHCPSLAGDDLCRVHLSLYQLTHPSQAHHDQVSSDKPSLDLS